MKVTSLQLPLHRLHPMLIDMLSHLGQSHFSSHLLQRQDTVDRDVPFVPNALYINTKTGKLNCMKKVTG